MGRVATIAMMIIASNAAPHQSHCCWALGVAYGAAAVGAAAAGAYGYYGGYYGNYYNNGCYQDAYGYWVCPNQYAY